MSRVEKFKETRKFRVKCFFVLVSFFILVLAGVCASDYSINSLMHNQKKIGIIEIEEKSSSVYLFSFMNMQVNIDTKNVSNDFQHIKNGIKSILGF